MNGVSNNATATAATATATTTTTPTTAAAAAAAVLERNTIVSSSREAHLRRVNLVSGRPQMTDLV